MDDAPKCTSSPVCPFTDKSETCAFMHTHKHTHTYASIYYQTHTYRNTPINTLEWSARMQAYLVFMVEAPFINTANAEHVLVLYKLYINKIDSLHKNDTDTTK